MRLYRVYPRIGALFDPGVLGYSFTYCLHNRDGWIQVIVATRVPRELLQGFLGVEEYSVEEFYRDLGGGALRVAEARLRDPRDHWLRDTIVRGLPGLASLINGNGAVCVSAVRDHALDKLFHNRARRLLSKASQGRIEASVLLERLRSELWAMRLTAVAGDKGVLDSIEEAVTASSTTGLKWVHRVAGSPEALWGSLEPRGLGFWSRLFPSRVPTTSRRGLYEAVTLPDPSLHRVGFTRGSPLPDTPPARSGPGSFRIGVTLSGREVRLGVWDLERHVYVVGQTGSGKTSFLKLLVHRLREVGGVAVVVIDPHGDMALELSREIPGVVLLDPVKSPFSVNPLDLPRHEDRDYAVTVAIDLLLSVFHDALKLMSTAVNVRYLLRVVLRALYSRSDSPTLGELYNTILSLYDGRVELGDPGDPYWRRQLSILRSMQRQTVISALSRLEPYARDKLLSRLTGRTSIDMDRVFTPGSITVFSTPKALLGEEVARLLASTILFKIWYEALARARLGKPRTPVFLVIDEFQLVAGLPVVDTILSEARKYGLHLVIAHQHTRQIPRRLLQSILTNTGVKIAFQVGGGDIRELSLVDADFAKALEKALTALATGTAVLKLTGRPGEPPPPPIIVKLDYVGDKQKTPRQGA